MPEHIAADTRADSFNLRDAELGGERVDRLFDERGFRAAWGFDLTGAIFKLGVTPADNGEKKIHPRCQFVFACMPALGTAVETFVVIFLGLLPLHAQKQKADVRRPQFCPSR
jgi:hypothetical protein